MTQTRTLRGLVGGAGQRIARGTQRLAAKTPRAPIKAKAGVGKPGSTQSATGSGIASPLKERQGTRTYFSTVREMTSADGLFTLEYRNPRQLTFLDAVAREVKLIIDDPDSW